MIVLAGTYTTNSEVFYGFLYLALILCSGSTVDH